MDSEAAPQPRGAKIPLKPHQLTLLARCRAFETRNLLLSELPALQGVREWHSEDYMRTRIGIIGDRAGSGKSYVVLSLLLQDEHADQEGAADNIHRQDHREFVRTYGSNRVVLSTRDTADVCQLSVLVIPHNMCAQWGSYVKAFFPDGFPSHMINNKKTLQTFYDMGPEAATSLRLVVVTCTYYNRIAEAWTARYKKRLTRLIFDEVDNANLPSCLPLDAAFTWFVTASYGNLLYPRGHSGWDPVANRYVWHATGLRHSGFVKSMFTELHGHVPKEYVKVLVVKNAEGFVLESMDLPPSESIIVLCRTPAPIRLLQGAVDSAIISCLNAGDTEGALDRVSSSNKSTEANIVSVILDKLTRQAASFQHRIAYASMAPLDAYDSEAERRTEIESLQGRLDEVNARMASIRERIEASDTCCICYDSIDHKTIARCCSNAYCFRCINLWLARRSTCPLCKTELRGEDLLVVDPNLNSEVKEVKDQIASTRSGPNDAFDKYENLGAVIRARMEECQAAKFLIFASFENTFNNVATTLDGLNTKYAFLKGNHDVVRNIVNRYKQPRAQGGLDALLVNTKNYGSGLNLENTTDIIIFHKFDNEIEKQVIGRANRMGRCAPLRVWYLLHANELPTATQVPP